jgi:hypothetical protein
MTVQYSVQSFDGVEVYLPKKAHEEGINLTPPNFYVPTVGREYPIGTRAMAGERVFRYCKASSTGVERAAWLAQNRNIYNDDGLQDAWEGGSTAVATAVGDETIIFADTNSNHIANFFQRGWMVMFYSANTRVHQILKNTAGGTTITFTLVEPIAEADADGAIFSTIHASHYSKVQQTVAGGSPAASFAGYPLAPFTGSYYGWLQTWGPAYCVPNATLGNANYERTVIGLLDGSIKLVNAVSAGNYHQRVGYALPQHEDDDQFIMLTIAP